MFGVGNVALATTVFCDWKGPGAVEAQLGAELNAAATVGKRVKVTLPNGDTEVVEVERFLFDTAKNQPLLQVKRVDDGRIDFISITPEHRLELIEGVARADRASKGRSAAGSGEVGAKNPTGATGPMGGAKDGPAIEIDAGYKKQLDGVRQEKSVALYGEDLTRAARKEEAYRAVRKFPGREKKAADAYMKAKYDAEYFDTGGLQHVYKNDNAIVDAQGNVRGYKVMMVKPPSKKGIAHHFAEPFVDRQTQIGKELADEFAETHLQVVQVTSSPSQRKMGIVETTFITGEPGQKMRLADLCQMRDCSHWMDLKTIENKMESIKYNDSVMRHWYEKFKEAHPTKEHGIAFGQGKNPRTVAYDIGRNKRDNVIVKAVDPASNPKCSWFAGKCWNLYLVDY